MSRSSLALLAALPFLLVASVARATPTTIVVDESIVFSSGVEAGLFPVGQPFRIIYTWEPTTADSTAPMNGVGAFAGSISAMTIELAGLTFVYGGGTTSNILTTDDQFGGGSNLLDTATLLPGPHVSGLLDGMVPTAVQIEATLLGPAPAMVVDDFLQDAYAFDFITVTLDVGSERTVISAGPGTAMVPEPALPALALSAALGLRAARRIG